MKPGDTFKLAAVWDEKSAYYKHFGIHPKTASLYGDDPKDIQEVTLKISENQNPKEREGIDYWGYFAYENMDYPLVWHKKFLLNMCFPYGMQVEIDAGKGEAFRLEIA